MNFQTAYEETDAVTVPILRVGAGSLWWDRDTETAVVNRKSQFDRWKRRETPSIKDELSCWTISDVVGVVINNTTAARNPVVIESIWPSDMWRERLVHRLDEGRIVNSTYVRKSSVQGSYTIEAEVCYSPEATAPIAVPEVIVAVPNLLAGYERYADANWDWYGAEPISAETVEAARQLLEMLPDALGKPHISPGSDGTIGFEWVFTSGPLRKLYIDVGPRRVWAGYWRRASGQRQTILPKSIDARTEAELGDLFEELNA